MAEEKENDHLLLERITKQLAELDKKVADHGRKLLYTRKEAAELLSISVASLQILIHRGEIRIRHFGSRQLIPHAELERLAQRDVAQIWPQKGPQGTTRRRRIA